ncbi:hypothetical protein FOZG_11127 [Fusarium oxysporum Fo47]|uniref:Uncharacterized protein n=1 Tax=Fusarium oxysporum Fo47 TaxID=660027 RepID=W9K605_FUSOX|nr:hypothetical protein FOZG_11127 [Fusarium oxysporum Fo47]
MASSRARASIVSGKSFPTEHPAIPMGLLDEFHKGIHILSLTRGNSSGRDRVE